MGDLVKEKQKHEDRVVQSRLAKVRLGKNFGAILCGES